MVLEEIQPLQVEGMKEILIDLIVDIIGLDHLLTVGHTTHQPLALDLVIVHITEAILSVPLTEVALVVQLVVVQVGAVVLPIGVTIGRNVVDKY